MWNLDYKESWVQKNWCFWTVVLEKTLESPLDCKGIQPVHPKGDQSWIFIGRTDAEAKAPILWPPDAKSRLIGKDPDTWKDWRQEEKGTAEDEMAWWHHQLSEHEFEQALGVEQTPNRGAWRATFHGVAESDTTEQLNWIDTVLCMIGLWYFSHKYYVKNKHENITFLILQYSTLNSTVTWAESSLFLRLLLDILGLK